MGWADVEPDEFTKSQVLFTIVEDQNYPDLKPTEVDELAPQIVDYVSKRLMRLDDTKGF